MENIKIITGVRNFTGEVNAKITAAAEKKIGTILSLIIREKIRKISQKQNKGMKILVLFPSASNLSISRKGANFIEIYSTEEWIYL